MYGKTWCRATTSWLPVGLSERSTKKNKQHVTPGMMKPHQTTFSKLFFDYLARQGIWWKFSENSTEKSMEYQKIWISSRISPYFQDSPPMIHMDSPEIRLIVPCKVPSSPINRLHQNTWKKHAQNGGVKLPAAIFDLRSPPWSDEFSSPETGLCCHWVTNMAP